MCTSQKTDTDRRAWRIKDNTIKSNTKILLILKKLFQATLLMKKDLLLQNHPCL